MGKRFYILFFVILALGSQPLNTYAENSESVVLDEAIFDFEPPEGFATEFSEPIVVTAASLRLSAG